VAAAAPWRAGPRQRRRGGVGRARTRARVRLLCGEGDDPDRWGPPVSDREGERAGEGRQRTGLGLGDVAAQEEKREERRGAEGELDRGAAHAGGKGRREGSELGLGRGRKGERRGSPREKGEWPGVAHAGRGRGKGELGRARRRFGLPSLIPSPFLFLFYTQSIQTKLFEFK
jgi:hypothetical protein